MDIKESSKNSIKEEKSFHKEGFVSSFRDRLQKIVDECYKGKVLPMAKDLGVSKTVLYNVLNGDSKGLNQDSLEKIAVTFSIDWLITGKGSMFQDSVNKEKISARVDLSDSIEDDFTLYELNSDSNGALSLRAENELLTRLLLSNQAKLISKMQR